MITFDSFCSDIFLPSILCFAQFHKCRVGWKQKFVIQMRLLPSNRILRYQIKKNTNQSRVSKSNVKQTLRFHYEHDQFDIRISLTYPIYLMPFNIFQQDRLDHDAFDAFHRHLQYSSVYFCDSIFLLVALPMVSCVLFF